MMSTQSEHPETDFLWLGKDMSWHSSICLDDVLLGCVLFSEAWCFPVHVRITLGVHGLDCEFWGSIDQCFGD